MPVGCKVGRSVGSAEGFALGAVGRAVGSGVGTSLRMVGLALGIGVGDLVGLAVGI